MEERDSLSGNIPRMEKDDQIYASHHSDRPHMYQ
jgi:hypothetical protein